jgi:hypothetical protein
MTFRLEIISKCVEPLERLKEYALTCADLPRLTKKEPHGGKLAIVGGGPSVISLLDELRAWDGEIWAINMTAAWLKERGIIAKFITVDPGLFKPHHVVGVEEAYLATACHPEMRNLFSKVSFFDLYETDPNGITGGTTTASRALSLAIHQGFYDITLYGCEGSFTIGQDHVDRNDMNPEMVVVQAGDEHFVTYLGYMTQCDTLSNMIRLAPNVFKQRSGGLLEAMIKHHDTWAIVAVSEALKAHLEEVNGPQGLYEPRFSVNHLMSEAS